MGCEVFTTVGTKEKKDYLMSTFPDLKPQNIGNSRDLSFEQMVSYEKCVDQICCFSLRLCYFPEALKPFTAVVKLN